MLRKERMASVALLLVVIFIATVATILKFRKFSGLTKSGDFKNIYSPLTLSFVSYL